MAESRADVFVAFGITGDLAKVMTFRSLYRLERRGLLHCPVVGVAVDDWTLAHLRRHMRESIVASGEKIEKRVFDRLAARLSYVSGDFADPATYDRLKDALKGKTRPVFYLEVPPFLFDVVVAGLGRAGMTHNARVVIEKPFGHDLASAKQLARKLHRVVKEEQLYRVDHFLGKLGLDEILYLRFANTLLGPRLEPRARAERAGDDGRELRRRGSRPFLRRRRDASRCGRQPSPAADRGRRDGAATARAHARRCETQPAAGGRAGEPSRYVRGQYTGYRSTPGVAARSTTETYAALELRIENERWSGVPFYVRAGKYLPVRQTEVRLIFRDQPPLHFLTGRNRPQANELVVRIDPVTGVRVVLEAHRADADGPEPITLDMQFADEGGDGPTPYETLFEAALTGDHSRFIRQDTVEESWRIVQPLLDSPPRVQSYRRGTWGPAAAAKLPPRDDSWREPWLA